MEMYESHPMSPCRLCPRNCGADRLAGKTGVCGVTAAYRIARCAPHMWEEPPISGRNGSGTVFFSGCNLRCVFCQNHTISQERLGKNVTECELEKMILDLQETGVHNINFVTPTHYTSSIARLLTSLKPRLHVPVVWNSGGYESAEILRMLEGLVDIYLPDFKYLSTELSKAYSSAEDYAKRATEAILEMYRQTGPYKEFNGLAERGLMIRHLVLPGSRADSIAVMKHIAEILPKEEIRVSVMRQYTPDFAMNCPYKKLHRRVTEFEYQSVLDEVSKLGLMGFSQGKDAANKAYTPDFEGD